MASIPTIRLRTSKSTLYTYRFASNTMSVAKNSNKFKPLKRAAAQRHLGNHQLLQSHLESHFAYSTPVIEQWDESIGVQVVALSDNKQHRVLAWLLDRDATCRPDPDVSLLPQSIAGSAHGNSTKLNPLLPKPIHSTTESTNTSVSIFTTIHPFLQDLRDLVQNSSLCITLSTLQQPCLPHAIESLYADAPYPAPSSFDTSPRDHCIVVRESGSNLPTVVATRGKSLETFPEKEVRDCARASTALLDMVTHASTSVATSGSSIQYSTLPSLRVPPAEVVLGTSQGTANDTTVALRCVGNIVTIHHGEDASPVNQFVDLSPALARFRFQRHIRNLMCDNDYRILSADNYEPRIHRVDLYNPNNKRIWQAILEGTHLTSRWGLNEYKTSSVREYKETSRHSTATEADHHERVVDQLLTIVDKRIRAGFVVVYSTLHENLAPDPRPAASADDESGVTVDLGAGGAKSTANEVQHTANEVQHTANDPKPAKNPKKTTKKKQSGKKAKSTPDVPLPMLSQTWTEDIARKASQSVFVQPKLDGVRCIADLESGVLWSRTRLPFQHMEHVSSAIRKLAPIIRKRAPELRFVDGELYNHEMGFQKLVSIVRRSVNKSSRSDREAVEFHAFDAVMDAPFRERFGVLADTYHEVALESAITSMIKLVPTIKHDDIADPAVDMESINHQFLVDNYEGTIIRPDDETSYKPGKRSRSSLKYKNFFQEEYPCLDVTKQDYNNDVAGAIVLQLQDGRTFKGTPKMTLEDKRDLWTNRELYKNSQEWMATVKYQSMTDEGIPRFPVVVGFRSLSDM